MYKKSKKLCWVLSLFGFCWAFGMDIVFRHPIVKSENSVCITYIDIKETQLMQIRTVATKFIDGRSNPYDAHVSRRQLGSRLNSSKAEWVLDPESLFNKLKRDYNRQESLKAIG